MADIFSILEYTPKYLYSLSKNYDEISSHQPIVNGKRSFKETLIHLLNIEGLNYTTIYPSFILNKPQLYPIHAERDFGKLNLFNDFILQELLDIFQYERKKTLSFLKSLKKNDWLKHVVENSRMREATIYIKARELSLHDFIHVKILEFQTKIKK